MLPGKVVENEHQAQSAVIEWCTWHERVCPQLKWIFATVNGAKLPYRKTRSGKRYSPEAIRLKSEGLKPGVSDLFLPVPKNGYCGLFIEMKVGSNKPSEDQIVFTHDMNENGYLALTVWGSENAIATIATYMGIPKDEW